VNKTEVAAPGATEASETRNPAEIEARLKMLTLCGIVDEHKAQEIRVRDVRRQTPIADYFVICTGTSVTHIQSIADGAIDKMRERARVRSKPEGQSGSFWIVLDYGDVILHIFDEATREFYDLERLWSDSPVVEWEPELQAARARGEIPEENSQSTVPGPLPQ
jgi:ribosome-associated protein